MRPVSSLILILALGLAACGEGTGLRDLTDPAAGPEEFEILPNKPLQTPDNLTVLPVPTPGSANLVDATPMKDVVAALGGKPSLLDAQSIPAGDSALIANASRYGVPAGVRAQTTAEDEAFRKRRGRFSNIRLFKTDRYGSVYSQQRLDARAALEASRKAGRKTPTAPPAN
jgi:hypothetical protein